MNLKQRYGEDTWALITGCTDGIGKGFAEELAKSGFNIILVARNLDKIQKVAEELSVLNPKIQTQSVVFDFCQQTSLEDYSRILKPVIQNNDISILINNVGMSLKTFFAHAKDQDIYDTAVMNMLPQTILSKFFIDKVKNNEKKSAIINLSSSTQDFPLKAMTLYSSTKAFNNFLSRSLHLDHKDNIDIMSLKPYFVETPMTGVKKGDYGYFVITKNECAEGALNQLGYEIETYGHWKHALEAALYSCIPERYINDYTHDIYRKMHEMSLNSNSENKKEN